MRYNIFLDDERFPGSSKIPVTNQSNHCSATPLLPLHPYYSSTNTYVTIVIIRNYNDFCYYIDTYGIPEYISFDHDLGEDKTGYDCALYLIDKLLNEETYKFPDYHVHSMNPVGKENIIGLIESFKKSFMKEEKE